MVKLDLDLDPHSEKLLDPDPDLDPHKMNADSQPWSDLWLSAVFKSLHPNVQCTVLTVLKAVLIKTGRFEKLGREPPYTTNVGTKLSNVGTELTNVGTELANVGTELSNVGTELANVGTELSNVGTELANVGTELANVGTELANVGTQYTMLPVLHTVHR